MKKGQFKGFILGVVVTILVIALAATVFADPYKKEATCYYDGITVTLDDVVLELKDVNGNTVDPFTISGTTYLPVRALAGALGLDVDWDNDTKTVILTSPDYVPPVDDDYLLDDIDIDEMVEILDIDIDAILAILPPEVIEQIPEDPTFEELVAIAETLDPELIDQIIAIIFPDGIPEDLLEE
ncbi:MAG: copper amine oxidase N-terminal domain-containing protein [Clostridiales bacterium]|nr:copper amine oxidase N-terminal domain-containing protein [Clostridiales bacterium]